MSQPLVTDALTVPSTNAPPAGEPCPTPLAWQQVVAEFESTRQLLDVPFTHGTVKVSVLGQGKPLYILGGGRGDVRLFAILVWLLREEFRCVLLESPQFRRLPRPQELPQACLEALLATADQLNDAQFSLLATSTGVLTALTALAKHPQRITQAVLQGGMAHCDLSLAERWLSRIGGSLPGTLSKLPLWRAIQAQNHHRWFPPYDETRFGFLEQNLGATPIATACRWSLANEALDLSSLLSTISQPVLVIRCEGDGRILSDAQTALASTLPHGQLEELHSTGQFPHLTHTHRFAKLLRTFLS